MEFGLRADAAEQFDTVQELITASRGISFGPEVTRRIIAGTFLLSRKSYESYYVQAQRVRRLVAEEFASVFGGKGVGAVASAGGVDVLLTPTAPTVAPLMADARLLSPTEVYANDVFTVPASLAGLPAISVPAGVGQGRLPLGLQLIGPRLGEEVVLRVAQAIEDAASKCT
jgi:aspartyl-tRNA(Asn)/glutamyl-tRNA(Gln) amidotransferase subunit A